MHKILPWTSGVLTWHRDLQICDHRSVFWHDGREYVRPREWITKIWAQGLIGVDVWADFVWQAVAYAIQKFITILLCRHHEWVLNQEMAKYITAPCCFLISCTLKFQCILVRYIFQTECCSWSLIVHLLSTYICWWHCHRKCRGSEHCICYQKVLQLKNKLM